MVKKSSLTMRSLDFEREKLHKNVTDQDRNQKEFVKDVENFLTPRVDMQQSLKAMKIVYVKG